jgi:hypothetical protein
MMGGGVDVGVPSGVGEIADEGEGDAEGVRPGKGAAVAVGSGAGEGDGLEGGAAA